MEKGDDRRLITKSRCFDFSLVCVDLKVFICVDEYAIDFGIFLLLQDGSLALCSICSDLYFLGDLSPIG
jgi:hypothetical protein